MFDKIEIPNKEFFKVNEVCALTGVKSYVLRFWETEFPEITPISMDDGQKLYTPEDIDSILKIKTLLYKEKFSIERAKKYFVDYPPKAKNVEGLSNADQFFLYLKDNIEEEIVPAEQTSRAIDSMDMNNILRAKEKLRELMNLADSICEKYQF